MEFICKNKNLNFSPVDSQVIHQFEKVLIVAINYKKITPEQLEVLELPSNIIKDKYSSLEPNLFIRINGDMSKEANKVSRIEFRSKHDDEAILNSDFLIIKIHLAQ